MLIGAIVASVIGCTNEPAPRTSALARLLAASEPDWAAALSNRGNLFAERLMTVAHTAR